MSFVRDVLANLSQAAVDYISALFGTFGRSVAQAETSAAGTALFDAAVGDTGSGGLKGMVPAPGAGDGAANRFLKADATWAQPPVMTGDAGAGGVAGYVPAPAAGDAAAGKYLKADGTWEVPPGGSGGGGGSGSGPWELVESQTSGFLFTDLAGGYEYQWTISDIVASNDGVSFYAEVSDDNGGTWKSTSYKSKIDLNSSGSSGSQGSGSSIPLSQANGLGNASSESLSAVMWSAGDLASTTTWKHFHVTGDYAHAAGVHHSFDGGGHWEGGASAIDAVRFTVSAGSIASGTVTLWRRAIDGAGAGGGGSGWVFDESTTTDGIAGTTDTGSSFSWLQGWLQVHRPVKLASVVWTIRNAGDYTLTVRDPLDDSVVASSDSHAAPGGTTDEDIALVDGPVLIPPGVWIVRLTRDSGSTTWRDARSASRLDLLAGAFTIVDGEYSSPSGTRYYPPMSLTFHDSDVASG